MACEPAAFIGLVAEIVFAYVLLPPLESLCIIVETVVQDKVVASLCKIGVQMKERDVVEWFIPFVTVDIIGLSVSCLPMFLREF